MQNRSRTSRDRRLSDTFHQPGSGDTSVYARMDGNTSIYRFIVSPDPADATDRDVLTVGLHSTFARNDLPYATSARFDGNTSNYLSRADGAEFDHGGLFSVFAWFKTDSVAPGTQVICAKRDDTAAATREWILRLQGDDLTGRVYASDGVASTSVQILNGIVANTWYFGGFAWDSGTGSGPINLYQMSEGGSFKSSSSTRNSFKEGTAPFTVGRHAEAATPSPLTGNVGQILYWDNRQITQTQFLWLANNGRGRTTAEILNSTDADNPGGTGLISWDMTENSGTRFSSTADAFDLTENGTVTGGRGFSEIQVILGIIDGGGFVEVYGDSDTPVVRIDPNGVNFTEGGLISEAADGAITVSATGTDPDIIFTTASCSNFVILDDSNCNIVLANTVGIYWNKGSNIEEDATDGALTITSTGSDGDIIFATDNATPFLTLDDSTKQAVLANAVAVKFDKGGLISEAQDGELTFFATGTDPDISFGNDQVNPILWIDESANRINVEGTYRIRFDPKGAFFRTSTFGAFIFKGGVDTNADYFGGTDTYDVAIKIDESTGLMSFNDILGLYIGDFTADKSADTAFLEVDRNSTSYALPVVSLRQRDVSEEFIQFRSSAAASNTVRALVNTADVSTVTAAAFARVEVIDDGGQITNTAYYIQLYTIT